MALTELQIEKLKPRDKEYTVKDVNGLYLRVFPSGTKTWACRYTLLGKQKRLSIGNFPVIRLLAAREKFNAALRLIESGVDPAEQTRAAIEKRKKEPTFSDMFLEYWAHELSKTPSGKDRKALVDRDCKAWENKRLTALTRRDAVLLIRGVRERSPVVSNRLLGVLVRAFNFAVENGILEVNPLIGMKRAEEKARSRVLTDDELVKLWHGLSIENSAIDISHIVKLALRTILLTGQRPGEVVNMRWVQINDDCWTIPAETTKTGRENKVPLFAMFEETIEAARKYSGKSEYVFLSPQLSKDKEKPEKHIRVLALSKAVRRHYSEMGIETPFTPHDLRRTFRTRLAELGISDVVAEKCLGHTLGGVLAVYNRHEYLKEKQAAYSNWETRLKEILEIENKETKIASQAG